VVHPARAPLRAGTTRRTAPSNLRAPADHDVIVALLTVERCVDTADDHGVGDAV
jgi:hypothetical protein